MSSPAKCILQILQELHLCKDSNWIIFETPVLALNDPIPPPCKEGLVVWAPEGLYPSLPSRSRSTPLCSHSRTVARCSSV